MASQQEEPRKLTIKDIKRRKDRVEELLGKTAAAVNAFVKEANNEDYEHLESQAMFAEAVHQMREISGRDKYDVTSAVSFLVPYCNTLVEP